MLRLLARMFTNRGKSFASAFDRSRLRTVLGVASLEDRTVPAAIPLTGPNGGAWIKIDTLTIATRTNQNVSIGVTSNVVLDAGVNYLAVASGTARIANDATGFADAEFIRYNKSTGPQDGSSPGYAWNNHGVRIAGVSGGDTGGNFWGGYEADHVYFREVTGQGTKVTGWYSDIPGYYGDNSGTLTVNIFAEVPIVLDLDVNANSKLGDPGVDGAANYLPGYEGDTQKLFSGTFNSGTFTPQRMKIVLDGIGRDTPKIARVVFKVTSTRLPGYASNMTDPKVTGAGKENDFSFHRDIDSDVYTIDVNSGEHKDGESKVFEGGVMEGSKTWLNFFAKDFGGAATLTAEVFTTDDANKPAQTFTLKVPADEDNDGIADKWEKAMLGRWKALYRLGADFNTSDFTFFTADAKDDKELEDPDGTGPLVKQAEAGDAHTVFEEYRGYILDGGGLDGQGKNGHAGGHIRLDPARKEILVEVDHGAILNNVPDAPGLPAAQQTLTAKLKHVLNGASGVFSNADRGAGIFMYYLLDDTALDLPEDKIDEGNELFSALGNNRKSRLQSDFIHLLMFDKGIKKATGGKGSGATTIGRPATNIDIFTDEEKVKHRGSLIATTDLHNSFRVEDLPKRDEMLMTTIAHELTHQLFEKRMVGAFNEFEHTTTDLADLLSEDAARKGYELATVKFLAVVQAELLVKTGEWGKL